MSEQMIQAGREPQVDYELGRLRKITNDMEMKVRELKIKLSRVLSSRSKPVPAEKLNGMVGESYCTLAADMADMNGRLAECLIDIDDLIGDLEISPIPYKADAPSAEGR